MESKYLGRDDDNFPERLKAIKPPINGLWYRGDIGLLNKCKMVAIVGSRRMSRYGKQVIAEIVPKLIEMGYVTISGFMYGVDLEMHRATLENCGITIGVFGWGIDSPVLPESRELHDKVIESNGLFISELPPDKLGELWTFPQRNRIVVGLADLVIVIEAGIKSGSLNSAEWGRKLGKPVYAVPGSIFSPVSSGCNYLLEKGWAKPLTLDYFKGPTPKVASRKKVLLSDGERDLMSILKVAGPQSLNELVRRIGLPVSQVSANLTSLLLKGEVEEERGIWCVIK